MFKFFKYLRFQYLFWKLHSRFRDEDEWIISEESLILFERCFQLIDVTHFKRLNRRYLQTIPVISYTGGLVPWLEKCQQALDNIVMGGEFPPSWGYLNIAREMTLAEYISSDDYWREPRSVIIEVFNYLFELEKMVREGGELASSYRMRKSMKLFIEAISYLEELLFLYKENQYVKDKKGRKNSRTSK